MRTIKNIVIVVVTVLLIIIALQNRDSVETKILFVSVVMPRAFLLVLTLLIGFVVGVLTATKLPSFKRKS